MGNKSRSDYLSSFVEKLFASVAIIIFVLCVFQSYIFYFPGVATELFRTALYSHPTYQMTFQDWNNILRLQAGFPEPSIFGSVCSGLFAFFIVNILVKCTHRSAGSYFDEAKKGRSYFMGSIFLSSIMFTCCLASLSTTAFIGLTASVFAALSLHRKRYLSLLAIAILFVSGMALFYLNNQDLFDFIFLKANSSSLAERQYVSIETYRVLMDTNFIGAGLGVSRSSGFLFQSFLNFGLIFGALYILILSFGPCKILFDFFFKSSRSVNALAVSCAISYFIFLLTASISIPESVNPLLFITSGFCVGFIAKVQRCHLQQISSNFNPEKIKAL